MQRARLALGRAGMAIPPFEAGSMVPRPGSNTTRCDAVRLCDLGAGDLGACAKGVGELGVHGLACRSKERGVALRIEGEGACSECIRHLNGNLEGKQRLRRRSTPKRPATAPSDRLGDERVVGAIVRAWLQVNYIPDAQGADPGSLRNASTNTSSQRRRRQPMTGASRRPCAWSLWQECAQGCEPQAPVAPRCGQEIAVNSTN